MVELAAVAGNSDDRRKRDRRRYLVLNGEVLVTMRGRPIDLVESGEVVDTRFWPGAEYLATIGCRVLPIGSYH